jgi:hypothetical protein
VSCEKVFQGDTIMVKNKINIGSLFFIIIGANGLALGEEADFEVLNCLPALNLIQSTKLHLSTEPAFLPNACYQLGFFVIASFKRASQFGKIFLYPKMKSILYIAIVLLLS